MPEHGNSPKEEPNGDEIGQQEPFLENKLAGSEFEIKLDKRDNSLSNKTPNKLSKMRRRVENKMANTFTINLLRRRFPIIVWLPTYTLSAALYDLVAGITVGLTSIPTCIGYAAIAGLPLQYGLYSAFMGLFVYAVMGGVKEASVGPTAVLSLMTLRFVSQGGPLLAVLLAFLTGLIELLVGLLNLGFIIEFMSAPVITGFCYAAALTVASTQIKGLFGLKFKGSSFVEIWQGFFTNLTSIRAADAILGWSVILLLLLMRKITSLKNLKCLKRCSCLHNRFVDGFIWFIATSRNAIAVISGCTAAYILQQNGYTPFTLTGDIQSGLPPFSIPSFVLNVTSGNNTVEMGFSDILSELGASLGLIPMVAILEHIAIAKAFASGKRVDASQEMIALGIANIFGSFFGSIPITSSFGRSSVQAASGVRTPFANVYGGILVLLALYFLMPSLAYIPKAILAAVIITSVIFLIELDIIKHLWKSRKSELVPFLITFFCCLFINMEYGILIGAGVHLIMLAYMSNRPHPEVTRIPGNDTTAERIIVKADGNIYYPGVESFRKVLSLAVEDIRTVKLADDQSYCSPYLLIDLSSVSEIDYTSLKMLKAVASECQRSGMGALHFSNANKSVTQAISTIIPSKEATFVKIDA